MASFSICCFPCFCHAWVSSGQKDSPNEWLTNDANWTEARVVAISVGTCGVVLTRVVFTEVDACGTVITHETLPTATVIAVHTINAHFVVWTTRMNTVINVHLTVRTLESCQTNQNVSSLPQHVIKKKVLHVSKTNCRMCKRYSHRCVPYLSEHNENESLMSTPNWRKKPQTLNTSSKDSRHLVQYYLLLCKQFLIFCRIPVHPSLGSSRRRHYDVLECQELLA
jgi:hypothetical protein